MTILGRLVKQSDQPASDWQIGWNNAKILHEVVYVTIESTVILAALQIALEKHFSIVFALVYGLAWVALSLYLIMFFKFFLNVTAEKFEFAHRNRAAFLWGAGVAANIFSCVLPFVLPKLTAAFVITNFMQ